MRSILVQKVVSESSIKVEVFLCRERKSGGERKSQMKTFI